MGCGAKYACGQHPLVATQRHMCVWMHHGTLCPSEASATVFQFTRPPGAWQSGLQLLIDLALTAVISLTRKMACQNLLPDLTDLPHASAGCPSSRSTTPPSSAPRSTASTATRRG